MGSFERIHDWRRVVAVALLTAAVLVAGGKALMRATADSECAKDARPAAAAQHEGTCAARSGQ